MNVTLRVPTMTRDQFLDWAERQDTPYEFDGFEPVAMTSGTLRHGLLCTNLLVALRTRLRAGQWDVLIEAGLATIGNAVRYPDVIVLPTGGPQNARLMPDVIVAIEVLSPSTGRLDRTTKLREYREVATIQRYIIVDSAGPEMMVFSRPPGGGEWTATALLAGEALCIPELGVELPADEIFAGVAFD